MWLRALVPGALVLLASTPFLPSFQTRIWQQLSSVKEIGDFVPAVVLGAAYNILGLRRYVQRPTAARIGRNINDRLLAACAANAEIAGAANSLIARGALSAVFYELVDNDKTLSEKAKRVRFNGLLWSSVADVITIGTLSVVGYCIAALVTGLAVFVAAMFLASAVVILSVSLFMPLVVRRHLALSNEQLDFITLRLRGELCRRLSEVARRGD